MSEPRKYCTDIDFDYNEILKGRIENVTSLPSGLGTEQAGYTVYLNEKLYVYSGTEWNTWNTLKWGITAVEDVDADILPTEATAFNCDDVNLTTPINRIITYQFEDAGKHRTHGILNCIGSNTAMTTDNWNALNGTMVLVVAKLDCWFNVKNYGIAISNSKPIYTNNGDVKYVERALFVYKADADAWYMLSWTPKRFQYIKRLGLSALPLQLAGQTNTWQFDTQNFTDLFPYIGYYQVDTFVKFAEYSSINPNVLANILNSQTLSVKGSGDGTPILVDSSPYISVVGIQNPPKFINNSLQGSAIVNIDSNRNVQVTLYIPNGQWNEVFGGYLHIEYVGQKEGKY